MDKIKKWFLSIVGLAILSFLFLYIIALIGEEMANFKPKGLINGIGNALSKASYLIQLIKNTVWELIFKFLEF